MQVGIDGSALLHTRLFPADAQRSAGSPDELFEAWLGLPDSQRHEMDAECRDISELSCDKGCRAIIDEAAWHLANDGEAHAVFVEQLATLSNHFERAMTTFLDHHAFWKGAALFYHTDSLPYWRKRTHLPHVPAAVAI